MSSNQTPANSAQEELWIAKYRAALAQTVPQDESRYDKIRKSLLDTCKQFVSRAHKISSATANVQVPATAYSPVSLLRSWRQASSSREKSLATPQEG
jgi:hypothetical protein